MILRNFVSFLCTRRTRLQMRKNKPATDQKAISREKRLRGVEICRLCVNWRPQKTSACAAHCSSSRLRSRPTANLAKTICCRRRSRKVSRQVTHLVPVSSSAASWATSSCRSAQYRPGTRQFKQVPHTVNLRAAHNQQNHLQKWNTKVAAVPGSDRCQPTPVANWATDVTGSMDCPVHATYSCPVLIRLWGRTAGRIPYIQLIFYAPEFLFHTTRVLARYYAN